MTRVSLSVVSRLALLSLTLTSLSCGDGNFTGLILESSSGRKSVRFAGGLVQSVTIDPASPAPNGDIRIRSVITNRGSSSVTVTVRECGLDLAGTLAVTWTPGTVSCDAYSSRRPLARGESITAFDYRRVSSSNGDYEARIRHALDPEHWIDVPISVR